MKEFLLLFLRKREGWAPRGRELSLYHHRAAMPAEVHLLKGWATRKSGSRAGQG